MTDSSDEDGAPRHVPVMPGEVLRGLDPRPGDRAVDGTVGLGGHAAMIAEKLGTTGALLAMDRDPEALRRARARLADAPCAVHFAHDRFDRMAAWAGRLGWGSVERILLDLGVSSMQLDVPERGFSFRADGPLDMRMDPTRGASASALVAELPEGELARLFRELGEERHARRIAGMIAATRGDRPIRTTGDLAARIAGTVPGRGRIHPATRVFQALRMAVNDELGCLWRGLGVITFHSLEDRLVKRVMVGWEEEGWGRRVPRKAVLPERGEMLGNRRARSAKLRIFARG